MNDRSVEKFRIRYFRLANLRCLGLVLGLAGLGGGLEAQSSAPLSSQTVSSGDILVSNLDLSVDPGKDFFDYANGGWLARNPIPASEAAWGIGNLVNEELYSKLRKINEDAAKAHAPAGSEQQKIGDFWTTAMDEARADSVGLAALRPQLALIDSIKSVDNVIDASFALRPIGVEAFCGVSVGQDEKQSDVMSVHIAQGGLGLPERDFYFNPDEGIVKIRVEYVAHVARMLKLLGRTDRDANKTAQSIMKFETSLAKASRKLEELRDPEKNYNKMSPGNLTSQYTPLIAWDSRLGAMSLYPENVIVGQPEFFTELDRLVRQTSLPVLKDYLRIRLLSKYANYLGKAWDEEAFAFSGKILSGQKEQRPRWKRVLDSQGHAMGMVLGKIFVREYFPAKAKKRYVDLVEAIRAAYRDRIEALSWMSPATKAKAQEKLAKITSKVGYPDEWKDYSALTIGTNSYCENMMSAARWRWNDMLSKFGKPVDRKEWQMTPQTYNAYYEPANNEIVLPAAGFTVPGVRDEDLDDALVYGYAGASTIGHEITHGFDDEGRQFDPEGNLKDWWAAEDAAGFKKRSEVMVEQFNAYEPLPGLHINGRASLGENLADYGGLLLGFDAFKKTEQYRKGEKIAGLTPTQRYFLGYALGWLHHQREELLRQRLLSDVHAPAKWRVIGPLANIPEFDEAFGVKPGQPMWRPPETHVHVW
jgi:putative endopeptidase